ncbi:MAG: response regulator transcription factor [Opitutaceae bacterium]|nr:response regulator transcription factor [Opitutaceae bacterium]
MKNAPFRLWLIEDNALFRRTVGRIAAEVTGVSAVDAFGSCEDALRALDAGTRPDTVLIDVGLPGIDGIEGIRQIKSRVPAAQILVLTVFEEDEKIFRAVCAGASGYLLKSASMQQIADAIAELRRGGSPMTPRVARRVLEMFSKLAPAQHDYGLAPREREVLELFVQGRTNKEIAAQLNLSVHTIDSYNRSLYEKLHVNTRSGAVAKALKERLV